MRKIKYDLTEDCIRIHKSRYADCEYQALTNEYLIIIFSTECVLYKCFKNGHMDFRRSDCPNKQSINLRVKPSVQKAFDLFCRTR